MPAKRLITMKVSVASMVRLCVGGTLLAATAWPQSEAGWRIHTIAGTGKPGHGGDGGPASEARFSYPSDVAADRDGNVYIADFFGQRIRKVDTTGTITTLAGVGEPGYGGDGGPAAKARLNFPSGVAADHAGNVYITDTGNHRVRRVETKGNIATVAGTGEPDYTWTVRRSRLAWSTPKAWQWTAPATSTLPVISTLGFAVGRCHWDAEPGRRIW